MTDNSRRFIGRRAVLATLQRHLDTVRQSGAGRIVAVRGRRQVGKSTVVERFVETSGAAYVFVTGVYEASAARQLEDATLALNESRRPVPDAELLAAPVAGSWREWLDKLALAARGGPVIAVLDEFPWLAAGDSTLEGELQVQWDRTLEKLPVLLILIGSDVAMMDRLASHGRPLFGRLSPLVVSAFDPAEIAEALAGRPALDVFDAYLVTGGYPRLVTDLARHHSPNAADYVTASLVDLYSPLVTTARLSLDAEFPEPQFAAQVLSAIGSADTARPRFTDVLGTIADDDERKRAETATTRALRTLTEAKGLVERERPAWTTPSSKLRRYRVTDPYLRFWFRYVERNVERIARGRADLAIAAFERDWSSWRGHSVEPVVREALTRLAARHPSLEGVETVLPWWTRDGSVEVDVVAATAQTTALIGTIKWRAAGAVTEREIEQLSRHRDRIPHGADARLAAISPSGEAAAGADVSFSAADLLSAWR